METLSDKMIQTGGSDGFLAYDVKEFIRKLKEGYAKEDPFLKRIDKLAGDKLI